MSSIMLKILFLQSSFQHVSSRKSHHSQWTIVEDKKSYLSVPGYRSFVTCLNSHHKCKTKLKNLPSIFIHRENSSSSKTVEFLLADIGEGIQEVIVKEW